MKSTTVGIALAAGVMLAGMPLQAAPRATLRLAPSSPWQLDYSDDSCRMIRSFGTGEQRTVFLMERFGPSDGFALAVAGKPLASARLADGRPVKIDVQFGPTEAAQEWLVVPARTQDMPGFLATHVGIGAVPDPQGNSKPGMRWITPAREAAIANFSLSGLSRSPILLELGPMGKPMAALDACTEELLTHWGLDLARYKARSKDVEPAGNPGNWLRSGDYPRKMIRGLKQGVVQFRLMVDTAGKPTLCHVQSSTEPSEFEDAVCNAMMKRASFNPALDAEGKPIASYFRTSARFQIQP